jgi:SET domain-containing protein
MKHIYVCKSEIEGFGMNIGEPAKKGEVISQIKGEMKFKVNKNKRDALAHPNWVGVAENQWIDPAKPFKFLNHSCNPSAGIKGALSLVALHDMKEGDEITIDYSTIEGDPRWEMNCACGEKNCRKVIRSIYSIPKKQFDAYLPYVSTYFKKLYLKGERDTDLARV